jgi:hypothetical protein
MKWTGGTDLEIIAGDIKKYGLESAFEAELKQFPDKCRADVFRQAVKLRMCHEENSNETERQFDACERKYPLDQFKCMGSVTTAEKKSQNKVADCNQSIHHGSVNSSSKVLRSITQAIKTASLNAPGASNEKVATEYRGPRAINGAPLVNLKPNAGTGSRAPASATDSGSDGNRGNDDASGISQ